MGPITLKSSTLDLTDTKGTVGSHASSMEENTFATARPHVIEASSLYLTAGEGLPVGHPCASSTRKRDQMAGDLCVQATKSSREALPACSEDGNAISAEQLRFTTVISRAMSKELANLLSGRDPTQDRPSVNRESKEGFIDDWLFVMRRFLQRNPDDKT